MNNNDRLKSEPFVVLPKIPMISGRRGPFWTEIKKYLETKPERNAPEAFWEDFEKQIAAANRAKVTFNQFSL